MEEKIGLKESPEKQPNAYAFDTRPCGFAIRQSPSNRKVDNPGQGIIIWWNTPDASTLCDDLKRKSIPIVEDLKKTPFGMTFSFEDPDGYTFAVHDGA